MVRDKIKNFARQTPRAQAVASDGQTYPCPPYKIIILDEADSMTQDAQGALRRIMENYARITRFCLVCNYVTRCVGGLNYLQHRVGDLSRGCRIIEPLASRCSKFRFTPLPTTSSHARVAHIGAAEHVTLDSDVVDALINTSQGDLRRAITYLQSASRLSSSTNPPTPITMTDIQEIAGVVPDHTIEDFARNLGIEPADGDAQMDDGGSSTTSGFEKVRKKVSGLMREGYSAAQLLSQVCSP